MQSEKNNVAEEYSEVVSFLRESYSSWWKATIPLMVNEGLPLVKLEDQPLAICYFKQLEHFGIPDRAPDNVG